MPEPATRLLAGCDGGDCPEINGNKEYWIVQGYDTETGEERRVLIPRSLGHQAAANDA